ncbi:hypothetical protein [Paludibaculum fermentans]|uniref:Uncharacterized protein n=1 Tax=Paludibaculum fermentans TaxID=1473598 RepID=A0A7S7SLJ4_PALFE|nr:hypothetical protein [Paludibaculum fermentans]QOY88506.1 hypothetical protein IRI77_00640 [Paludibaculum fermentans]
MSQHDFPVSEWSEGLDSGNPDIDLTDPAVCAPVAVPLNLPDPQPAPDRAHTKNVIMVIAMCLAVLASSKPRTFAWLTRESLAYLPILALAYGLVTIARFRHANHRNPPSRTHAALLLMMLLVSMVAVAGFWGSAAWPGL